MSEFRGSKGLETDHIASQGKKMKKKKPLLPGGWQICGICAYIPILTPRADITNQSLITESSGKPSESLLPVENL